MDGTRVRIPAELVEEALASAPREWTIKPRGGDTEPLVLDATHTSTTAPAPTCCTSRPGERERRRVRRADVEGMAALCEKLPNIDFVMSMGLPEDAPQAIDDLVQVDAMLRGTRKPLLVAPRDGHVLAQDAGDGGACGEEDSFGIYAMPSPPLISTRTREQGHRLRRAPHPADLGAGAEHGHHRRRRSIAAVIVVGQRRDARRPRAAPGTSSRARRSSTASAPAR